nr:ATP-dependent sacrificial sulfur transferase LarE [bacterium]
MDQSVRAKCDALIAQLKGYQKAAVAFSGGVDSSLLAAALVKAVGPENALAITAVTDLHTRREREQASQIAKALGIRHLVCPVDIYEVSGLVENGAKRCYYCKKTVFGAMQAMAEDNGFDILLDGSNADDAGDFRPGRIAVRELGIPSPLLTCGLSKEDIREASQLLGVPGGDRPSLACLATRLPIGTPITHSRLQQIDSAETALEELGFAGARVRHHGEIARIEVAPEDLEKATVGDMPKKMSEAVRSLGHFAFVTLDLEGYRRG